MITHADVMQWAATYDGPKFHALICDPPYLLSFMNKDWDSVNKSEQSSAFRSWFAGLVAGEAYFRIHKSKGGEYYACHFGIHMRADEAPMLRALQAKTGAGSIKEVSKRTNRQGVNSAPSLIWLVESKADCWKIARLLDGAPLYGKKQREYDLWRKALDSWTTMKKGNRWHGRDNSVMESLYLEMKTLRPFDFELSESAYDPFGPPEYQFHYKWITAIKQYLHPGAFCMAFSSTRTYPRMACAFEDAGFAIHPVIMGWVTGQGFPKATRIKDSTVFAGHRYGLQALKPALEPIIVAQKPYSGKPIESITKTGAGALWIDGARIESNRKDTRHGGGKNFSSYEFDPDAKGYDLPSGRWPANFYTDDEGAARLDEMSGELSSGARVKDYEKSGHILAGHAGKQIYNTRCGSSSGGASRFFYRVSKQLDEAEQVYYTAKASRSERDEGLNQFALQSKGYGGNEYGMNANQFRPDGSERKAVQSRNIHPTVKPIDLCKWLATLLLPPKEYAPRRILIPFAGTGSEIIGALHAGWEEPYGIEREAEYVQICEGRIKAWKQVQMTLDLS